MQMSDVEVVLDILALLFALSAAFGFLNHHLLRLPHAIGLVIFSLAVSLCLIGTHFVFPGWGLQAAARGLIASADFSQLLLQGVLSFMLFAGALNVNLADLFDRKWSVLTLATFGVIVSTGVIGFALWLALPLIEVKMPLAWCFVFGALISPTDPLAVLGILREIGLPRTFEAQITGESLFNDGVGIVVFTIAVAVATGDNVGFGQAAELFAVEALGGVVLGFVAGYIAFVVLRAIDEYNVEIQITLALVAVTYAIALRLNVSGPLAVVVAGLFIGNHGTRLAMSELTNQHVRQFWSVIDEILNSLLFIMIGFEILAVSVRVNDIGAALLAIPLVLVARLISLVIPLSAFGLFSDRPRGTVPIMTWGSLRGGISVALALSLPETDAKAVILTATYGVVIFSIIVQGLTIAPVARRLGPRPDPKPGSGEADTVSARARRAPPETMRRKAARSGRR
jgi:CPA1 family monovalent cation:H+ antiporter